MELLEFYPTPKLLLEKILGGIDWRKVGTVLEPSAGKGDIVSFIKDASHNYPYYNDRIDIDCIEKDPALQNVIKGSEFRLVHDDFLTYKTEKHYNLIIMNPPFSEGDKHLTKALDMQEKAGGDVICILNAETIKNPYTNLRKTLVQRLKDTGAEIEYMTEAFSSAERTTDVEIAVIKVHYEEPELTSNIFEGLRKKAYAEGNYAEDITDLAPNDFVEAIVKAYEIEVEAGIKLIHEYRAMAPRLMPNVKEEDNKYANPLLELKVCGSDLSVNRYVELVRMKYWSALFADRRITGKMTTNLRHEYDNKVQELKDYEFSIYNIKTIQIEMTKHLVHGVEDCIVKLFDDLTEKHSWYPECEKNIHYYSGWATNKAWIINKKVILPFYNAFDNYSKEFRPDSYDVINKLADIEKALDYLDGGLTYGRDLGYALQNARETGNTKNIRLKYFDITFYKKGTCHITFTNEELWKKFNIFGSQQKGWLPPSYGKKHYREMDPEEKAVIDEFEGETSYNETMCKSDYYIFDAGDVLKLEDKSA